MRWSAAHSSTSASARRGSEPRNTESFDFDQRFELAIERMKMRRLVVAVKHSDDNSKEPAQFWHRCITRSARTAALVPENDIFLTSISPEVIDCFMRG
jgi:hypothetical protein